MLVRAFGVVFHMAGQMDLAIFADDLARLVGENSGVEVMSIRRQLRIAEIHRHLVLRRALEQRPRRSVRHLALEPIIELGPILHIPAREEGRERQFRIDDQVGAFCFGFVHQRNHALDHGLAAVGFLDRAHLGGGNIDDTHQRFPGDVFELSYSFKHVPARAA